jgi:hypothetical protein
MGIIITIKANYFGLICILALFQLMYAMWVNFSRTYAVKQGYFVNRVNCYNWFRRAFYVILIIYILVFLVYTIWDMVTTPVYLLSLMYYIFIFIVLCLSVQALGYSSAVSIMLYCLLCAVCCIWHIIYRILHTHALYICYILTIIDE